VLGDSLLLSAHLLLLGGLWARFRALRSRFTRFRFMPRGCSDAAVVRSGAEALRCAATVRGERVVVCGFAIVRPPLPGQGAEEDADRSSISALDPGSEPGGVLADSDESGSGDADRVAVEVGEGDPIRSVH